MRLFNNQIYLLSIFIIISCGGGGGNGGSEGLSLNQNSININVANLVSPGNSYQSQNIEISSENLSCQYELSLNSQAGIDLHHLQTNDGKIFSFRNPIIYEEQLTIDLKISTIPSSECQYAEKIYDLTIKKFPTEYALIPTNISDLKSNNFQVNDIGFGGIIITDTYTATICYPTPNDCQTFENERFGQDAHNMIVGDFNGDGFEDFAVAWAFFPHTIAPDQKVNAPVNIYLNDGDGRFYEDLTIFSSGSAPTHPMAYRMIAEDFNNDGFDDIFAGSMGLQYRDVDYSNNFIEPRPHLLLLSNSQGKLDNKSDQIQDNNNGDGQLCGFAHDASAGDPDGDGDIDIYACNILNINDGNGNFSIHNYINLSWQQNNQFGNPMSSLLDDLNNDGYDDLIFWTFDNRQFSNVKDGYILLSNQSANIENWSLVELPPGPFGFNHNKYNHAASGDLNNDGFNDVVVAITRDIPYYEGAYIQILMNNGQGSLLDKTQEYFENQPRKETHHGEGNIYLRDMNLDGFLDIVHSTRDYNSGYHGANIAINDGNANFSSLNNSELPMKPDPCCNNYDFLMKALPINSDNEACLDFISVTDAGWEANSSETSNYFFSVINTSCNF
tara:strand:- start:49 stop:1887 length:1839 start_codon:yes stop_codon:yes gene_type:complete